MLDGSDYNDLLNAEYQYKVHKSDSSIMSVVYWTIGITAAVAVVACLIVFLLTRKKKDDDEEEKQAA